MHPSRAPTPGYTLIELLAVIALIAALTVALGIGLRSGNDASTLAATQGLVRAQLDTARARASLQGRPAALALFADPAEAVRFLRELGIAQQDATGAWTLVADGVSVPGEVRFTDPAATVASAWSGPVAVQWDVGGGPRSAYLVRFAPNGALADSGGGEIGWLAPDSGARGGLVVSRYGAVVALEPAPGSPEAAP